MSDALDNRQINGLMPVYYGEPVESYDNLVRSRLEKDPSNGRLWLLLGSHQRIRGNFSESEKSLRKALQLTSMVDSRVLAELALLYRALGRNDDAELVWRLLKRTHRNVR